jgi:hypothetical protein
VGFTRIICNSESDPGRHYANPPKGRNQELLVHRPAEASLFRRSSGCAPAPVLLACLRRDLRWPIADLVLPNSATTPRVVRVIKELRGELTLCLGMRSIGSRVISTCAGSVGGSRTCICDQHDSSSQSRSPFVEYECHYGVCLLSAGGRRAFDIIRHHRLIETISTNS